MDVKIDPPPPAALLPDRLPVARHLDPAAALAYRTALHEHLLSADGKAAGVLTLLGLMFTVLARFGGTLAAVVPAGTWLGFACAGLLTAFAAAALGAVAQAFRTISPRFPKAPPSLAFFGDIARLTRNEYVARMRALSAEVALEQMLIYNHTSAVIVVSKFRQLGYCFRCFRVGAVCWVLLVAAVAYKELHG